ncbi:MAG: hypothetical protein M3Q97_10290, partial [Bacteroidota bacterium]|nr:hypothetical protein [Bacteroidota bacterium]
MKLPLVQVLGLSLLLSVQVMAQTPGNTGFDAKKKYLLFAAGHTLENVNDIDGRNSQTPYSPAVFPSFPAGEAVAPQPLTVKQVMLAERTGLPSFIETHTSHTYALGTLEEIHASVYSYLALIKSYTGIEKPEEVFVISRIEKDDLGFTHVRMTQVHHSVAVYGAEIVVHFSTGGQVFNGQYYRVQEDLGLVPSISIFNAISNGEADIKTRTYFTELSDEQKAFLDYHVPFTELVVYRDKTFGKNYLAYHVTLRPNFMERWEYFVDAVSGRIIHGYDHTCHDGPATGQGTDLNNVTRSFNTYLSGSTYYLLDISRPMYQPSRSQLPGEPAGGILTLDA